MSTVSACSLGRNAMLLTSDRCTLPWELEHNLGPHSMAAVAYVRSVSVIFPGYVMRYLPVTSVLFKVVIFVIRIRWVWKATFRSVLVAVVDIWITSSLIVVVVAIVRFGTA
ncbi:uncharacterized protein LAESUDRAFT_12637 [Laetiporus sulphureus 93-53]|uniref:Uncharacterized protein n=1 Tax=Laetiporus sulphureus 93-53 TaxID=1314785 RepID=A0A165I876_9APHY|nr:uncharacterized protein LAESUDRAFT_12637 [Laetiporus sulphureus 93-53]KZT12714.1 hypothetical protein LAESUDRAFT_12637 [Laetiporus sulphureus 93-53]